MERRGCGVGCFVAWLGLALSICLLPYLISSIYALAGTVLNASTPSTWLWGDWVNTWPFVSENETLYVLVVEGPMCCGGILALLIVILGAVMMVAGPGRRPADDEDDGDYGWYEE